MIQQTLRPLTEPRRMVLFAADHGVVAEGVSAWPAEVTALMIDNIRSGGAASSVLAVRSGTELRLIDVGSLSIEQAMENRSPGVIYRHQRLRAGSRNLYREAALSPQEFESALQIGRDEAALAAADGMAVVACGEMGIGNTTAAACLTMLLADVALDQAVGRGAGADDVAMGVKRKVVNAAVRRARDMRSASSPAAMASIAGFEIVAMAGFMLGANAAGLTIVLDGYIATAAALIAGRLCPDCTGSMIASHVSAEAGHSAALAALELEPFLNWELRLGEGTGALLLMPLLDAAAAICGQMRSLAELGIAPEAAR
jgi:nicotinate-nucleotide--dimethylbenzimidazole phosphoribosyltransferase